MPAGGTDPDPGRVLNEIQNYTHLTTDVLVANGTTTPTFKLRITADEWRVDAAGDHLISAWSYERVTGGTDGEGNTLYLLAGAGRGSDWVRNLETEAAVSVELAAATRAGRFLEVGRVEAGPLDGRGHDGACHIVLAVARGAVLHGDGDQTGLDRAQHRAGGELVAGSLGDDLAAVDEGDLAAELLGLFEVMGGEQDGGAFAVHLLDVLPEFQAEFDVDTGGGFVEDQQPGTVHQGAGENDAALHAAGQGPGAFVPLLGQRERLEELAYALLAILLAHAEIAAVEVERLLDGQEPVEVDVLGRQADGLACFHVVVHGVVAEDPDLAAGRA